MTRYLFRIATLLVIASSCGSSKKTDKSGNSGDAETFTTNKLTPVIDGKADEWPSAAFSYDKSTKALYAVANDETHLYIILKQADRMQQMKMVNGGTEIWIDPKVKKNKNLGVAFPLGGESMTPPSGRGEPDRNAMRKELKAKMVNMSLSGFKSDFNGKQSIYSNSLVKPVIDWDEKDDMVYELGIPLASLPDDITANISNVSIGIYIKALKMPEGFGAGGPPGGGMPGGGMPPGGMRPPGGGNMPDRDQMENMTKDNSFWTKYTVARK